MQILTRYNGIGFSSCTGNTWRNWKDKPERKYVFSEKMAQEFNQTWGKIFGKVKKGTTGFIYRGEIATNTIK